MKKSIYTYSLVAALTVFAAGCQSTEQNEIAANAADNVKTEKADAVKPKTPQEEYREAANELRTAFGKLDKQRISYESRIFQLKKMLLEKKFKDARLQLTLNEQIINYCQQPPWTHIGEYDYTTANTELLPAAKRIINNPSYTIGQKMKAIRASAFHYCDIEIYDKAEKDIKDIISKNPNLSANDLTNLQVILAHVYRYWEKYDKAMDVCREIMKTAPEKGAETGAEIALLFRNPNDADAILSAVGNEYFKLSFFGKRNVYGERSLKPDYMNQAVNFVKNTSNSPEQRLNIAQQYLFESYGSDELGGIRRSLTGIPAQLKVNGWNWKNLIRRPFQLGDFKLAAETYEIFEGSPAFADTAIQKIYVISLGACGRKSDGAKFAAKFAADEKCTPADKARFLYYQAILSGKSTDNILKNISLTRKEQSEVILSAARQCLTWNMSDLSEKYSAQYDAFFAEKPERSMNVMYSEKTIDNIDAWRKIYPKLDKQMCDIPFKGSMDFLETDVATGNRSIHFEKNSKTSDRMEVSSVCDRNGLHIFLRVQSDKSRAIEQGFANGIGTEMYFSAGKNQPYICIGSEPKKGVSFIFHTAYNNKTYQRENKNDPKNSFRDEVQFTDSDYVLHLFFSWQDNFDKLPAPGHDYRFECLSWCPDGGFSWGGSQGIHAASSWGSLRFSFTDKQLAEIRRELIFSAYKKYKMVPKDPHTSENLFEIWADKEIGDPEFYRMKLAPLECELDYYAKMVKQDMSDEEVTEVYTKALPRWKSLKHIVDQLRWEYLNETINDENIQKEWTIATTPMHRLRDVWWSGRVDAKLNEIGNHPEDVQIVFLGDSITHFWEKQGINVIRRDFKDYNVLNAGISGDRTQQTIWLIEKSNIFPQVQPKLIVLMIGTNNIGWGETRVPGTTAGIRVILDLLRQKCPKSVILLYGIFPRAQTPDDIGRRYIREINDNISKFADGKHIFYEDLTPQLTEKDGTISREMMPDFLHPAEKGYEIWSKSILKYVHKYVDGVK